MQKFACEIFLPSGQKSRHRFFNYLNSPFRHLIPLFINHNSLKTYQDLTNVDDYLEMIESAADKCSEEPPEELPNLRRQLCTFPDAMALVWIFNDTFSEKQKHTVCSSRVPGRLSKLMAISTFV